MKTDLFQSCGHCWVFQMCWHTEGSTFTASSFRIWNCSNGIPSLPLALFVVMLSKAHSTSHSRISGSMWVITPSWLSWSWRSFFYSSSVYSCHHSLAPGKQQRGNTSSPINRKLIEDLLSMALPIRTRLSFPLSQSLPSGSFHKPLILLHQREDRLKTTITEN